MKSDEILFSKVARSTDDDFEICEIQKLVNIFLPISSNSKISNVKKNKKRVNIFYTRKIQKFHTRYFLPAGF